MDRKYNNYYMNMYKLEFFDGLPERSSESSLHFESKPSDKMRSDSDVKLHSVNTFVKEYIN